MVKRSNLQNNGVKTIRAGRGGTVPPAEYRFQKGNPGGPGRPPIKHIRERIHELMAEDKISLDELIYELRKEDRALFTAYGFGRPQSDVTSGGKPINGVVVIGPDELKDI